MIAIARTVFLMLALGLVVTQNIANCAHKVGDELTGTYCLSCDGSICTRCYNGFVDNGRCALHNIPNCLRAEKDTAGRVICKECSAGYHVTPQYPETYPNACSPNPTSGSTSYVENCGFYSW
mgnify:CR=1 FL=1